MPRTPLFRTLRRSYRLAQLSLRTGEPPLELVERSQSLAGITRRRFLETSSLAAAAVVAGCTSTGPSRRDLSHLPEVAVFGAGIAGLTAAYRLSQRGVPVRVYEAQERVGGRMYSLRGAFPDNHVIELGGELIDTGHTHIRELVRHLGLTLEDYHNDDPKLAQDVWFFEGKVYSDAEVVAAFRPVAARIQEALGTLKGDWVSYAEPNGGEALDRQSLAEWLNSVPMERWFHKLLDVAYTGEYGLEIDHQSALNLLLLISAEPEPFEIFGDSDERFHIHGGNDQVPTRLAERLGSKIERGARLEAVSRGADGRYSCSVRRGEASSTVSAEHVILALPFTLLRDVKLDVELPAVKKKAITELGYGTNAKLMVSFSQRLWRTVGKSNGSTVTDLPFQATWETTRLVPGESGILVNFTGGRQGIAVGKGTPASQAEAFAHQLDRVYPGISKLRQNEVLFHWPSHPFTRGSYSCYKPGQYTGFGGEEATAVDGLHFAGEHTSQDAQGYLEGGCESGDRAAHEILVDLGLAKPDKE
ncbi:MAG: NAD(P)/FAD-dependent oxidoreductase [Thermoanaerobaculia bacterium]